ncbi:MULTISPECIES: hypothetical protein [unclassified Variovorax]|uniref:hypothetical protein n=1 Tax=unclassified Variovorax TaxID=663243 RepID=UPI003ED0F042
MREIELWRWRLRAQRGKLITTRYAMTEADALKREPRRLGAGDDGRARTVDGGARHTRAAWRERGAPAATRGVGFLSYPTHRRPRQLAKVAGFNQPGMAALWARRIWSTWQRMAIQSPDGASELPRQGRVSLDATHAGWFSATTHQAEGAQGSAGGPYKQIISLGSPTCSPVKAATSGPNFSASATRSRIKPG